MKNGEEFILCLKGFRLVKTYANTQHALPCKVETKETYRKATLTEDKLNIYATGERFSYLFSKHYGMFTSIIVDGEEQLAGNTKLSAFRAPTDNERHIQYLWMNFNVWQGENLDCTFNKIYNCYVEGGTIVVEGSLAGVSRKPLMKHTMYVDILQDGRIDIRLHGNIREDACWLPRLGFEYELPLTSRTFTYFGRGVLENYCDMCHSSSVGMYQSNVDAEYVNYVRPQEHGNHTNVKMLRIGKLEFVTEKEFEINVSKYSAEALFKAEHTDELVEDGKIHLRIDYKDSGIGSHSCGPELPEKYRLSEKVIDFAFSIRPFDFE